uniref:uncharacterized protein LOC124056189 n=1 Tax=Scatophagus argus TaxID=75038 RepID=UPI001ED85D6E|nr:uncharacterized protein LOC124056189 [Scatophagus argus]
MDDVLEGAVVLCVCKLGFSLLFLPSLAASRSPISFCCCCLIIFTDVLVTAFLSFLCVFESQLTDLTGLGDVIALRFLLFLSHIYGVVLLLTAPLIAVETVTRLMTLHSFVAHRRASKIVMDPDGQRCYIGEVTVEKEEEDEEEEDEEDSDSPDKDKEKRLSRVVSYFCCLSLWVVVALSVRWQWKVEEVWAATCLHTTNSLIRCLPNLLSPITSTVSPCWIMAFLSLLLLVIMTSSLYTSHQVSAQMAKSKTEKHGVSTNGSGRHWEDLDSALPTHPKSVSLGMSVSATAQCVDPEKTESSCAVHSACCRNSVQMSALHHRDFVLISPECLSAGQEHERTKTSIPLTFSMKDNMDSENRSQSRRRQWGFSCLGVNVMIVCLGVLSTFVLPLNLSVNILLIRTIETLLELCIRAVVSFATSTRNMSTSHYETFA